MAMPKLLVIGLIIAMLVMFVSSSILSEPSIEEDLEKEDPLAAEDHLEEEAVDDGEPDFLSPGLRRFLATVTCNKNPKICRRSGSAGKTCCKKKCVNTGTDRNNCGKCGRKCRSSYSCCKGNCRDLSSDRRNCGGCGKMCRHPKACRSGVCGYA